MFSLSGVISNLIRSGKVPKDAIHPKKQDSKTPRELTEPPLMLWRGIGFGVLFVSPVWGALIISYWATRG